MRYILTVILLWMPLWSKESKIKILVVKEPLVNPLLYTVMWNEGSIVTVEELRVMLDCIKNRVEHKDFPDSLDLVLNQSGQFKTTKKGKQVSIEFIKRIDSLWKLPKKYDYLYFRSAGYSKKKWMNRHNWIKLKKFHHEFAY